MLSTAQFGWNESDTEGDRKKIRKKWSVVWVLLLFASFLLAMPVYAYNFFTDYPFYQARPDTEDPRILMVGNSLTYTNDIPALLRYMCRDTGINAAVDSVTQGGHSLTQYAYPTTAWEEQLHEKIMTKLTTQKWDYVILQGRSDETIVNEESMRRAVAYFYPYIKNAGAQMVLYLTWAPDYGTGGYDIDARQGEIAKVYYSIARQYNCALAPSGIAFARERRLYPDYDLYYSSSDRLHPNLSGSYLSACCIYATLFGKSPDHISYTAGLASEKAGALRGIASDVTLRRSREEVQVTTAKAVTGGYQLKPGGKVKLGISASTGVRMIRTSSSDEGVATVSSTGVVTARAAGTASITALMSNNKSLTWKIVVTGNSKVTLGAGDTEKIDFSSNGFRWTTSNKKIAVIKNGTITAKAKGTATLTGKHSSGFQVKLKVTVKAAPEKITVKNAPKTLVVGRTFQLKLNVSKVRVTYKSSAPGVVSVSKQGVLTAKGPGTAKITVKSYNGKKTSFRVTVKVLAKKLTVTNVKSGTIMRVGQTRKLKVSFSPRNVSSRAVTYKSSNTKVLKVSKKGTITALHSGRAKITVTAADGSKKKAAVEIRVRK